MHTDTLAVLDFWFAATDDPGHAAPRKAWFSKDAAFDAEIERRFGPLIEQALAGGLDGWITRPIEPLPALAQVIVLDQFTRNVFRGDARAFSGDTQAQQLVLQAIAAKADQQLPWVGRVFLYMPLMHAETRALQTECVARFVQLVSDAPEDLKERLRGNLDFARQHEDIIARFGRFPYRNAALGRANTADEEVFLTNGPRFGQ